MLFFTSDLHLSHKLMVSERGFNDIEQMNYSIIRSINNLVRPDDDLYILGDLSFANFEVTNDLLALIKGRKYLIAGNHDNRKMIDKLLHHFVWVKDQYVLKIKDPDVNGGNQKIFLHHCPMLTWPEAHHGSWQAHGHSHGSLDKLYTSTRIDVGWDIWRRPLAYEDIKRYMSTRTYKVVDHHSKDFKE